MYTRSNWADEIWVRADDDSLVVSAVRLTRPKTDLLKEGYADAKRRRRSEPLTYTFPGSRIQGNWLRVRDSTVFSTAS